MSNTKASNGSNPRFSLNEANRLNIKMLSKTDHSNSFSKIGTNLCGTTLAMMHRAARPPSSGKSGIILKTNWIKPHIAIAGNSLETLNNARLPNGPASAAKNSVRSFSGSVSIAAPPIPIDIECIDFLYRFKAAI
jgi:hypothetical protein